MDFLRRRVLFVIIIYGLYYTGIFLWFKAEIFEDLYYLLYLAIFYLSGIADTFIRPVETEKKEEGSFVIFILFLFMAAPFLLILAILEQETLYEWRNQVISIIGVIVYFFAAMLVLSSRINLGKQATGVLVIREEHDLITTGIYKYVRHPMYGGVLIGVIGFGLVAHSIIVFLITFLLYLWIFNNRAKHEEEILLNEFGDKFQEYITNSKKFIPFIY
ncbi:MAG: methyltransferase family protein [Candidatus Kariarchaeaceae archaeon]|jgi:protein-S-isoprenylcysteine O-methyltransferase Ste14